MSTFACPINLTRSYTPCAVALHSSSCDCVYVCQQARNFLCVCACVGFSWHLRSRRHSLFQRLDPSTWNCLSAHNQNKRSKSSCWKKHLSATIIPSKKTSQQKQDALRLLFHSSLSHYCQALLHSPIAEKYYAHIGAKVCKFYDIL
jgi:hypothetical protein